MKPETASKLRRRFLAALAVAALALLPAAAQAPYYPSKGHELKTRKLSRVIRVGATQHQSDFTTLARAYAWLDDQTRDATHEWLVVVDPDADISSPGSKPTYTHVLYLGNTPSTAAACANGQVQTYVSASDTWACGSATTGGVTGPGTSVASALASWTDTTGAVLQEAGTATLAGNPALAASGLALATTGLIAEGSTADAIETLLVFADPASSDKTVTVPATTGTLALINGYPTTTTFAAAAGAANVAEVTITVKDAGGTTVAAVHHLDVWLSDAATCAGLTGTTASGTVQAKAASGVDLTAYTAKKALHVQTLATGVYILEITDTAKTGFYVCSAVAGKAAASAQLVAGDYGA